MFTSRASPKKTGDVYPENAAFAMCLRRVQACIDEGSLKGDAHAMATLLWTTVHGAVAAMTTFPDFPVGDPLAYAGRVVDLAIGALAAETVKPLD
jgi:hypothetical protein